MLALVKTVVGSDEEAAKVLEASRGAEVKKKLGEDTEWAVREEAFGLPWFVGECLLNGRRSQLTRCSDQREGRDGEVLGG
jgi:hypothetical protein